MSEQASSDLTAYRVFRIRQSLRTFIILLMCLFIFFALVFLLVIPPLLAHPDGAQIIVVIALTVFAFACISGAWVMYELAFVSYIATSAQGIKFNTYGYSGDTTWDNLDTFSVMGSGQSKLWGIHTLKPIHITQGRLFRIFEIWNPVHISHTEKFLIPMREFAEGGIRTPDIDRFHESPLGLEIDKYAPQVFTHVKQVQGAK